MSSIVVRTEEERYFSVSDYKPIITYYGDAELFKSVEATLCQALPHESTSWRRSYGRTLKSVTISAVFVPFSKELLEIENKCYQLKHPILHTFWTQCSDLDTYKNSLHDEIKHWLSVLNDHKTNDWLIVLVETYDFRKHNKLLPRTTVLDKIKSDFGAKHADRCFSVINPLKSESRTGPSWRGLIVNMRLLILTAYDNALLKLEEIVRTQREARNQQGWTFCQYFLLQEELAFVLEMLGIYEDALVQYDELDALFTQFIKNSSLGDRPCWLSSFEKCGDSWRGVTLTDKVNVTYRQAIKEHNISLLDFRCYLFSRQTAMLLLTCKPGQVAQRSLPFIHNCLNELKILEINYPRGAISCWVFLSCAEILEMCKSNAEYINACSYYTAPILQQATIKLYELGELCGLMPDKEATSQQLHTLVGLSAGIGDCPTNSSKPIPINRFKQALSSKDSFQKYYLELLEEAMVAYKYKGHTRSAHLIGQKIAEFYIQIGDIEKSIGFLINALVSYEHDKYSTLADTNKIKLLHCYRKIDQTDKFVPLCLSLANSKVVGHDELVSYFEETINIVRNSNQNWNVPLEGSFSISDLKSEPTSGMSYTNVVLDIENKLPISLECDRISVSVCTNSTKRNDFVTISGFQMAKVNGIDFPKLPMTVIKDYQENKSLACAKVYCKGFDPHIRKQDNSRNKDTLNTRKIGDLLSNYVTLNPGHNSVMLKSEEEDNSDCEGIFNLGQITILIEKKLIFTSNADLLSNIRYQVKQIKPSINIDIERSDPLIIGISCNLCISIQFGTCTLTKECRLRLSSPTGLKILGSDNTNHLEVTITNNGEILKDETFSVNILGDFSKKINVPNIEHKISVSCPWTESEILLPVEMCHPFSANGRLHTAKNRKYYTIIIQGLTTNIPISISSAILSTSDDDSFTLKSFNTTDKKFIISSGNKVTFVWEIITSSSTDKCQDKYVLNFKLNYQVSDKTAIFNHKFEICNFSTFYIIEVELEAARGNDFCRVNTMCHLTITFSKVMPTNDCSLMYEVIVDQSIWAICTTSTGVVILDSTDKCSVTLDVMPLISGYLPLPLVNISKYFPVEGKNATKGSSPRLEPFSPGQVYNKNKATQIHVLPSSVASS